jgi:hypothetical protein
MNKRKQKQNNNKKRKTTSCGRVLSKSQSMCNFLPFLVHWYKIAQVLQGPILIRIQTVSQDFLVAYDTSVSIVAESNIT